QELAHETGGLAVINNNDLGQGVGRVMNDLRGYYLIGYRPSDTTFVTKDGKIPFHKITVKVKRSDLSVRSRRGFFGTPDQTATVATPDSRERRMIAALESPFAADAIHLRLTALFGNVPQTSFVRTLIHIDARGLTFIET